MDTESKEETDLSTAILGLWALMENGHEWVHASDISNYFRESQQCELHWKRIQSLLDRNRNLVGRRKRNRRWQYRLLDEGKRMIGSGGERVLFVDPSKAVQSVVTLHGMLQGLEGTVRVCDPYLDSTSVEHLDALREQATVRFLTFNIRNEGSLRRTVSAFTAGGRVLEVRRMPRAILHDRYIIDRKQLIILGSSLNGFAKKQCFIIKAGQDMRTAMLDQFDRNWTHATSWN